MRIAQIAPLIERIPPKKYGGTERVVSVLTEELVRRGHDVTLFASGDSETQAKLVATYPRALREAFPDDPQKKMMISLMHLGQAYERAKEFDIIHDHTGQFGVAFANSSPTPVVMTMHSAFNAQNMSMYRILRRPNLVTISDYQASMAPGLNLHSTVYNGLPLDQFPFSWKSEDYLLYVGRICPEKGLHHAIEVAKATGKQLIIAAKLDKDRYQDYFAEQIEPQLSEQIKWIGEVGEEQRNELYSKALCLLHPVTWPEPFGLTLIESMASGCPVIAFPQGSIPEVVKQGVGGLVVNSVEEMIQAVRAVQNIDRWQCRQYARGRFDERQMVEGYEEVYRQVIAQQHRGLWVPQRQTRFPASQVRV